MVTQAFFLGGRGGGGVLGSKREDAIEIIWKWLTCVGSLQVLIQIPTHLLSSKYLHLSTNTYMNDKLTFRRISILVVHEYIAN